MKSSKVASRYAKALLEIAIEQGKVDSVLGDMKFLLEINKESRDFEMLIQSPIVNPDKKIAIFELIFEQS
jgi:F-type H+-transporting ATPase subunit delta